MKRRTLIATMLVAEIGVSGSAICNPPFAVSVVVASDKSTLLVVRVPLLASPLGCPGDVPVVAASAPFVVPSLAAPFAAVVAGAGVGGVSVPPACAGITQRRFDESTISRSTGLAGALVAGTAAPLVCAGVVDALVAPDFVFVEPSLSPSTRFSAPRRTAMPDTNETAASNSTSKPSTH